ncbi:hypothetical protein M427DRAFT_50431 [Gonapodya prolifera JEL478]|uniref:UBC core domain-containing protein n=1 Tax=Gonapodya prolifera (strain JEL478) TaxID=1344416 RepID=A0A139AZE1_GONPJ|nr:hypothetical protein M427DRAFT_50431 [Gonapodya prolifera JEL478]|eukprot:KXS22070.1 hypothetical protein M427DRAFT_50431 [Gonapodya prolifera JEL478]
MDTAMRPTARRSGKQLASGTKSGSQSVAKRLQNELMALMVANIPGISAFPEGDGLMNWKWTLAGPSATVYEGLTFKGSMTFPATYPINPPVVRFDTKLFHPNVDLEGNICLDILKDKWSAVYTVDKVLLSLQALLADPNLSSPLNVTAAEMWDRQSDVLKVVLKTYKESSDL